MIRVKICGIGDPVALRAAAEADWVGFVFYPPSPRFVTPDEAAAISESHPGGPARVGLFVEPDESEIEAALAALPLAALQIHADPARVAFLRQRFGLPVWRGVGIATRADLPDDDHPTDAFLLDAKPPPGAPLPGGNALPFDWTLLQGWRASRPWLLAGGLSPGNVRQAIAESGATAVDVSSGVERARGLKDPVLIRRFIEQARATTDQAAS